MANMCPNMAFYQSARFHVFVLQCYLTPLIGLRNKVFGFTKTNGVGM